MIKVNFANMQRKMKLPINAENLVTAAIDSVLNLEQFKDNTEVNVSFVSDRKIKEINSAFRNINKSTDVLSFPTSDSGEYDVNPENDFLILGDVIISIEHAYKQAELFGHSLDREIAYLTVHSVLHLLGYDHIDEAEEKRVMRDKEEAALENIGLKIVTEGAL